MSNDRHSDGENYSATLSCCKNHKHEGGCCGKHKHEGGCGCGHKHSETESSINSGCGHDCEKTERENVWTPNNLE